MGWELANAFGQIFETNFSRLRTPFFPTHLTVSFSFGILSSNFVVAVGFAWESGYLMVLWKHFDQRSFQFIFSFFFRAQTIRAHY